MRVPVMTELRRRLLAPGAAILLPAYLSACFHYMPVGDVTPAPGTEVRATLASPTPFNLGTVTVNDVTRVEGTLVDTTADSLGVWVKWLYPASGAKYDANNAEFHLQRANVQRLEGWRLAGKQTALVAALAAGVIAGMLALVSLAAQGGQSGGGPPPPPPAQVTHGGP